MLAMMTLLAAAAAGTDKTALPDWMAGCWESQDGTRWTEECWTDPRAGLMLGSARSIDGERLVSWEAMQIMADPGAGLAFWASPNGNGRTRFVSQPWEKGLSFANAANDYPQRVRYWREGDLLMAEIAMADGSKSMRWSFRRR